jgi:hypothetical protein
MTMTDILRQYPEWMPIETAPKRGEYILLYVPIDDDYEIITGYHRYGGWNAVWVDRIESHGYFDIQAIKPTHWMPIPEAPK